MENTGWKKKTILFLISQSITLFGSTLVQMGIVWYVILKTSSGIWVSALTVCSYLPQFLISFIGGVWADKYNKKKLIILADIIIAVATFILMILMPGITNDTVLLSAILVVSVVRSLGAGVQTPAVNSVIPELVPEENLMKFNGINATMQSIVQFAAPIAAGAVLTFSTLRTTLLIDIVTAMLGIILLTTIVIPKKKAESQNEPFWEGMKKGIKYAFTEKFIGRLLILYGIFIFLCVPAGFLATLLVERVYGDAYVYLTAVEVIGFIGMTLGGVLMGTWGGFKKRVKTLLLGIFAFGALAIGMGAVNNFIIYLALMLIYGVALTMIQTATMTLIQEKSEESMQGRVFGLLGSMYSGFLPIGMIVFGPMADYISLRWIMIGSGILLIIVSFIMHIDRNFYGKESPDSITKNADLKQL